MDYRDGALRNAKGEALTLEYLDSGGGERIILPFSQALGKLGIQVDYRRADFALIQKRLDVFDFDVFTVRVPGSESPGSELMDRYGSKSADTEGSSNLIGVRDPAIDALLGLAVSANTRPELVTSLRALDRVLRHGHYVIPQWFSSTNRIAYRSESSNSRRWRRSITRPKTGSSRPGGERNSHVVVRSDTAA